MNLAGNIFICFNLYFLKTSQTCFLISNNSSHISPSGFSFKNNSNVESFPKGNIKSIYKDNLTFGLTTFKYFSSVLIKEYKDSNIGLEKIIAPVSISTLPFSSIAPSFFKVSIFFFCKVFLTKPSSPLTKTPCLCPTSAFSLNVTHPASFNEKSIFKGLNKRRQSPDNKTIPSFILGATPLIDIIISSNKVEERPSGKTLGTGENNFPNAEYCGVLLESPPLCITKILKLFNLFSNSFIFLITVRVAPPLPTRWPPSSGIIKNFVLFGKNSLLESI